MPPLKQEDSPEAKRNRRQTWKRGSTQHESQENFRSAPLAEEVEEIPDAPRSLAAELCIETRQKPREAPPLSARSTGSARALAMEELGKSEISDVIGYCGHSPAGRGDILAKISPPRNRDNKYVVELQKIVSDLSLVRRSLLASIEKRHLLSSEQLAEIAAPAGAGGHLQTKGRAQGEHAASGNAAGSVSKQYREMLNVLIRAAVLIGKNDKGENKENAGGRNGS